MNLILTLLEKSKMKIILKEVHLVSCSKKVKDKNHLIFFLVDKISLLC